LTIDHGLREQLESLHEISVEIAALRELPQIYERALSHCLELTHSMMGFVGLLTEDRVSLEVVAVKGFRPLDPMFLERFQTIPVRPSVFGIVITEERSYISNDAPRDRLRVGTPPGHPAVHRFLGIPLRVGPTVIGMIGVANKSRAYGADDERLLSTFANQVAVAIDNARLYERQRDMIGGLQRLQQRLGTAEREQLLALERDRIAAELHDDIEQQIFSIGLQLSSLLEHDALDGEVADRVREIRYLASRTAEATRDVIFALAVEGHGSDLTASLRRLLHDIARDSDLETDLVVTGTPTGAVAGVQGALHDVARAALNNVVKHANAHRVLVSVRFEPTRVDLVIQDDGVGASELALRTEEGGQMHFGLGNMRRQVAVLGGTLEAANGDDGGLTVKVSIPLTAPDR
jgi:signal transduction histidine kinase